MWMDSWVLDKPFQTWPQIGSMPWQRCLFRFFQVPQTVVVMSHSNNMDDEVNEELCLKRGVPILRRRGGGGTVVLDSGCQILTLAFYAEDLFANKKYFDCINGLWIDCLKHCGFLNIEQKGISDLAVGDKKIAGTSLFRSKHLLLFQGSLLVNPNKEIIFSLLKEPKRRPEYRGNRKHSEFITSLFEQFRYEDVNNLNIKCENYFNQNLFNHIKDHFYLKEN